MNKNTIKKHPNEYFPINADFNEVLATGESLITGSWVASYDYTGSLLADGVIIDESTIAYGNGFLVANCISGSDNQTYKLSFRAKTSNLNVYELDVYVNVRD